MCRLRLHAYDCSHNYLKPLFCLESQNHAERTGILAFCLNVSNRGFSRVRKHCGSCSLIHTVVEAEYQHSSQKGWAESKKQDGGSLRVMIENMAALLENETEEGILVPNLDENSDRGLGLALRADARYMLPPTRKGKKLTARFADQVETISEDGGVEWDWENKTDVYDIPNGLRYVQLSRTQACVWAADREKLDGDIHCQALVHHFWGKDGKSAHSQLRINRILDWVAAVDPENGHGPTSFGDPNPKEDDISQSVLEAGLARMYLGRGVLRLDKKNRTSRFDTLPAVKVGEPVDNYNMGTLITEGTVREITIPFSTGQVFKWHVLK